MRAADAKRVAEMVGNLKRGQCLGIFAHWLVHANIRKAVAAARKRGVQIVIVPKP